MDSDTSVDSVVPETESENELEESRKVIHVRSRYSRIPDPVSEDDTSEMEVEEQDADESIIGPRKKNVRAIISDESDEELEVERQALSPVTRKSLAFPAPDSTDDEESLIVSSDEDEMHSNEKSDTSIVENGVTRSIDENSNQSIQSFDVPQTNTMKKNYLRDSVAIDFEKSIYQKLSSTVSPQLESSQLNSASKTTDMDMSVEILEISDSLGKSSTPEKKLVQPKITAAVSKQLVSQSHYDAEERKLEELCNIKSNLEKLLPQKNKLPDKGEKMISRLREIRETIQAQTEKLQQMKVDESQKLKTSLQSIVNFTPNSEPSEKITIDDSVEEVEVVGAVGGQVDWNAVREANEKVQPKYVGKVGLKTFENQKAQTEKCLNAIHGSLATQPTENQFVETPRALKIELMDHQKHGLAWMLWREQKKPRGGILADDMGLGKTLSMISLIVHQLDEQTEQDDDDDSDEENDNDNGWTKKGSKRHYNGGTLVVCPASLLGQWQEEIEKRVKRNTLSFYLHHGANREPKAKYLSREDVVITTYNIVATEHKKDGPLFGIRWNRIILDEAHIIRNHKTVMSVACSELRGKYRWCLTGTPINNKEMDLFALIRFLRVSPFDDLPTYKRWLEDRSGGGSVRLHALIKTMLLRRTKDMLQEKKVIQLETKNTEVVNVALKSSEMNVYQKVLAFSRKLFTEYLLQKQERTGNYVLTNNDRFDNIHAKFSAGSTVQTHQILTLLLRLRQICVHPGLIDAMLEETDADSSQVENSDFDLLARLENLNISNEDELARAHAKVMTKSNPVFKLETASSKIEAVLNLYSEKILETSDKAIFVSQWSSVLRLFEVHLRSMGVRFVSLNGSVPVKSRPEIINQFNAGRARVMLLSLTAGGIGLNLSAANHLFLIDIHWNPQLENQAQDRIYRVGQERPVFIYKFICENTIESRIQMLQEKKLSIAHSVLTGAKNIGSKLSMQDLRSLFEI